MQRFLDSCFLANLEVLELINSNVNSLANRSNTIGVGGDISLDIDIEAESIFIKHLFKFGSILSEEKGLTKSDIKDTKITIDPIDGSSNFASNIPYYGTSIHLKNSSNEISVVTNLVSKEVFIKFNNKFKVLNLDTKLEVTKNRTLYNIGIIEKIYLAPNIIEPIYNIGIKSRSLGALALSIINGLYCRFVLFIGKYRTYDVEAALHIVNALHIEINEDFILVSKDIKDFNLILNILKKEKLYRGKLNEHY